MRFSYKSTMALLTVACGSAVAVDFSPKPVTYIEGNIEGITQNASGKLDLTNSQALTLRANDMKIEVPYAIMFGVERKEVVVTVEKEPLYKVWSLHKRIVEPTKPHAVSFDYKDKTGNLHSMTLEMDAATADRLFYRLQQADAKKAATKGSFWGDGIWKTHRNEPDWNAQHEPEATAVATTR